VGGFCLPPGRQAHVSALLPADCFPDTTPPWSPFPPSPSEATFPQVNSTKGGRPSPPLVKQPPRAASEPPGEQGESGNLELSTKHYPLQPHTKKENSRGFPGGETAKKLFFHRPEKGFSIPGEGFSL